VAGYLAFPPLNDYLRDEYLFARVPPPHQDGVEALDRYLAAFPDGRHAAAARELREDQLFARIPAGGGGLAEIDRYLTTLPEGKHAAELRPLRDDRYFALIPAQDDGGFAEIDEYLKLYPAGRHTTAARELRDDRLFTRAEREAGARNSPASLRDYLADPANERHRPDAQRRIADFYDRVIEDLKQKQAKAPESDREVFEAVFALLDTLKRASRPVVTVGFLATIDREPTTESQKQTEKLVYELRLKDTPALKAIADRQPNRSAILGCGQVFDPEQTARRESVILNRLRAAVQGRISGDILTLEAVPAGELPMLEVGYHIYAGGRLGVYTGADQEVIGLMRWYETNWVITVRSLGEKKEVRFKLKSAPASKLTYDIQPGDPEWGAYAVILYSGFYDMSASLIRSFGLDPGPAPNSFTFDAVARNKADEPDKPLGVPPWQPKFPFPDK
jgi:hypothetical protein